MSAKSGLPVWGHVGVKRLRRSLVDAESRQRVSRLRLSLQVCSGHDTDVGGLASRVVSAFRIYSLYLHSDSRQQTWVSDAHPFLLGRVWDRISHAMECCDGHGNPSELRAAAIVFCSSMGESPYGSCWDCF